MNDKHTQDSITNYNKIAKNYDDSFDGQFTKELKQKIVNNVQINKGMRVLDVACGNGTLLHMLNSKQIIEGYGIDVSNEMITEAKKRFPEFSFSVSNSSRLELDDQFIDIITVCAAFHHFSEPEQFLSESRRVLKDNGLLILMEPYFPPIIRQISNIFIPLMKMGDVKIYSKRELIRMLNKAGFSVLQYSKETSHGVMYIIKKN